MNIFGIGLPEMAIIFIVALLVFGPKKLPEIGRSFGKALRSFQDATKEFESEFKQEVENIERVVKEPMTATIEPPQPKALDSVGAETGAEAPIEMDSEDAIAQDVQDGEPGTTTVASANETAS